MLTSGELVTEPEAQGEASDVTLDEGLPLRDVVREPLTLLRSDFVVRGEGETGAVAHAESDAAGAVPLTPDDAHAESDAAGTVPLTLAELLEEAHTVRVALLDTLGAGVADTHDVADGEFEREKMPDADGVTARERLASGLREVQPLELLEGVAEGDTQREAD